MLANTQSLIDTDIVLQSYGRCCRQEQFFEHFYHTFIAKSASIRSMFLETDMLDQRRLVRAGVSWLIMYARGSSGSKLDHLGRTHGRAGYDVDPVLYGYWVESLLETVREFDPLFSPEIAGHWRETLQPGIERIRAAW